MGHEDITHTVASAGRKDTDGDEGGSGVHGMCVWLTDDQLGDSGCTTATYILVGGDSRIILHV